jgi:hypothetical protein
MDLFLEEIFERLPGIEGAPRGGRFHRNLGRLHVRSGGRVFFYRGPELVERTFILCILGRNPGRNRLGALELRSRVKKSALLATVQLKIAFRAFARRIETRHQHRATIRTARPRYRSYHPRRARTKMIGGPSRSALRRLPLSILLFPSLLLFGITIAAVTILAIHKRLRPSVATDCNYTLLNDRVKSCLFPRCIQSERYKRPAHQSSLLKLFWNAV